jgi:hypothetical protein
MFKGAAIKFFPYTHLPLSMVLCSSQIENRGFVLWKENRKGGTENVDDL